MDIYGWLRRIGLAQYAEMFRANDIDGEMLGRLTNDDLKDIGVASFGHRKKLLEAIAELAGAVPVSPQPGLIESKAHNAAERRQVTVMFSDLVGSTALSARMDPEDLREVILAYQKCVAETVQRFGGFVAKYMGDGVLIYFGYPQAHEDDAERAVRAGLELIAAVSALKSPVSLQTRVGIATGMVVVGDLIGSGEAQERGIVGETPNLAARLQGIAEPNTVVIAEGTRRLLGNLFELKDLGPKDLKGTGSTRAWAALRASSVESRFEALHTTSLTALIGREEETDLLMRRWSRAKSGEGQVVLLSGEAGIGKSRLTAALLENLAGEPHARLRYFCSPQHTDSAFHPVIGQMERAAGLAHDDTPRARLDKLDAVLAQTSTSKQDTALFAELLSLPNDGRAALDLTPPQRRQKTMEALGSQMETLARQNPVLMIFEDAHWSDPTSLELFGRAVDRIATLPVLLLVTFRPEFAAPWIGRPHVTALTLNRLAQRDIAAMIDRVVGNKGLPANIRQDIIERTDGIPLFVEEMTKAVVEAESQGAAEHTVSTVPSPALAVPASLHASLMARLDRLGSAKEVAQIGGAIGREFSHDLMAAVAGKPEAELQPALDRLVAAGLLFRQGAPPHATYLFKHALVQDAAYGTLLRGPRQELHARIAAAIETGMPERVEREPELLAHHHAEAGQPETAVGYWLAAGRLAARRSANSEAVAHLRRGIAAVRGLPETVERNRQELALLLALGPALLSSRGFGDADASTGYERAAELARRLGDDRDRFAATWGLWITIESRAKSASDHIRLRLQYLGEMIEAAERTGDAELLLQAHHSSWSTRIWNGEFASAIEHVRAGLALYDPERHRHHALMYGGHDPGVCGKGQGAVALWALGWPDQAVQSARESIALGEALDHLPSLVHSLWFATSVYFLRRQAADVLAFSTRLLALGSEHGLKLYEAIGGVYHGWALIQQLDAQAGLAELRKAVATYATTSHVNLDLYRAILAEAELRAGNLEEGAAVLIQGERSTDEWWRVGYLRVHGDLLLCGPNDDRAAAERAYRQAISVAAGQQAKSLELRVATSLAMLLGEQGRRSEGYAVLAPVYDWFTEGFDTLDLKEAKALLGELRA